MATETHVGRLTHGTTAERKTTDGDRIGEQFFESGTSYLLTWLASAWGHLTIASSTASTFSDPPAASELEAEFGEATVDLCEPFVAIVDRSGAGTKVWIVVAINSRWFYEELSAAAT